MINDTLSTLDRMIVITQTKRDQWCKTLCAIAPPSCDVKSHNKLTCLIESKSHNPRPRIARMVFF